MEMEPTDKRNDFVSQESIRENILENCTTDDSVENDKYDGHIFVTAESVSMVDPDTVKTASPFKDLFQVRPADLENVKQDMEVNGYDFAHPIILWAGHDLIVVDGHTRLAAAQKLMFPRIPVIRKDFKDEAEALEYAIKSQRNRRNLTDAELLNCLTELDKRKKTGPTKGLASREAKPGKSAEETAAILGVSRAKVERLRTVSDHGSDEIKDAVKSGEMSVNKAYNETMDARRRAENKSDSQRRTDMLFEAQKGIPKVAKRFMDRLVEKNPDILFSGAEARILYREICKELMNIINMATVPAEQLHQD